MATYGVDEIEVEEGPDFNQRITGYYGCFNTEDSYEVNYILSSLTLREFKLLDIASDAFKFDQVDFEEMVQRDVDPVRVQEEIIDQYLKIGNNKALFFPPLIVSVIAFDNEDKPIHQFNDIYDEYEKTAYIKRWDNYFAIETRMSKDSSTCVIKKKTGEFVSIYPHMSKLHYDDKKVKLVVIDGQHRFYALRELQKREPELIKNINLPICIVFSPDAIINNGGQDVMVNLRSMFVTINNKAKEVSGHFLDLLNDHSIASFCVRELANKWKNSDTDSLKSNLQYMEWNQRNKSKSTQVNKQHTITTVSIIADVLRDYVFNSKKDSKTYNLLNLGSRKSELEKHKDSTSIYYINEAEFDVEQAPIIRDLVKENVVPCLDFLFLQPSIYRYIQEKYLNALSVLESNISSGKTGWETFKEMLKDFKEPNRLSPEPAVIAEGVFNREIVLDKGIEVYRRMVFQQGYIRVWSQISDILVAEYEIPPLATAKCLVKSYEKLVFDFRRNLFDKDQPYAALVLYDRSSKPNVTVRGRQSWYELLMAFFAEKKTVSAFVDELKNIYQDKLSDDELTLVTDKLSVMANKALNSYSVELRDKYEKDYNNNWRMKELPKALADKLENLLTNNDQESNDEFQQLIKAKVDGIYEQSMKALYNVLCLDFAKIPGLLFESDDSEQI